MTREPEAKVSSVWGRTVSSQDSFASVLPIVLVAVLAGLCTYSLVTAFSLITENNGCISDWRVTHECQATLHAMRVPGRHEIVVAFLCALAGLEALLVTRPKDNQPVHGLGSTRGPRVEPLAVACGFAAFAMLVDPAIHGIGAFLALCVLLWLTWQVVRSLANALACLERPSASVTAVDAAERHIVAFVLLGVPLVFACTAIAVRFAEQRDIPHASAGSVIAAAVLYAAMAAILLLQRRYASLRQEWQARHAAFAAPVFARWLGSAAAILGALMVVSVAAPPLSASATETAGGLTLEMWGMIADIGSHTVMTASDLDCRHKPRADCQKRGGFNPGGNGGAGGRHAHKRRPKAHHTRLLKRGGQFAAWLIPILVLVMLLAWRLLHRLGMGGRLHAIWNRLRRRQRRLVSAVVDRLPASMVDPSGGGALERFRRLTGRGEPTPREQILRYYGSTVTYAGSHLVACDPAEAPEEYEETLATRLRRDREAWGTLTDEFLEARFSTHTIDAEAAADTRAHWQATRGAILDASRAGDTEDGTADVDM